MATRNQDPNNKSSRSLTNSTSFTKSKKISTWSLDDTIYWLKTINLTNYADNFYSNNINGYDLCLLTNEELKNWAEEY